MPLWLIVVLILLGIGVVWFIYSFFWGTPVTLNLAVERLGLRMLTGDPETLTAMGLLDNTLLDLHSGNLTDASPRQMRRTRQLDRDGAVR